MGDPIPSTQKLKPTTSFSLPPGCRFHPSQHELVSFYLANKNRDPDPNPDENFSNGYDLIGELNLFDYDPFELPDDTCFSYGFGGRKRHWYCYCCSSSGRIRSRRKTKNGYWKRNGKVRDVVGPCGRVQVGSRKSFVFYLGNSPETAFRTSWVLYEYALLDHPKASFVVCRVFSKSRAGNSISDNGLSSCAEESISAVRHIGTQHDGYLTSDTVEAKIQGDNSVDGNNEIPRYPKQLGSKLEDQIMTGPVSVASLPFPSVMQPRELVSSTGLPGSGSMFVEGLTDQQLSSILEEGFIELNDLMD
ncbi:NAC domain-containing protein 71-like [Castanea sativa]|uniref:NAC domain-containing protein 71-like n=1 Tax=Castanea sativa TaxID=21020 RepID=UPI003F64D11E